MVIQDIQEVAQYLEVKFKISLEWQDARVMFYNIKTDEKMNSLTLAVDTNYCVLEHQGAAQDNE